MLQRETRLALEPYSPVWDLLSLIGYFQPGSISEIVGSPSSGRTSLVQALLRNYLAQEKICALIDWGDAFDPTNAACNGIVLEKLLWIRGGRKPHGVSIKIADHLLHIGGFGLVVLDLCDIAPRKLSSIPLSWWYRLHKTIEHTLTMLIVVAREPVTGPCARRVLDMQCCGTSWTGSPHFPLLAGFDVKAVPKKPVNAAAVPLHAVMAG